MKKRRKWNPNPNASWYAAHASLNGTVKPIPESPRERTLWVQTDYFTAGAIWQKLYGVWSCKKAAPILAWMYRKTPAEVHLALLKMGADFQWLSATPDTPPDDCDPSSPAPHCQPS